MAGGGFELALGLAAATAVTSWLGTWLVLGWLERRAILDHPNERSSHARPTPRGGGLAVTPVACAALILAGFFFPGPAPLLAGGALILLAVSWVDDRKGLPALPRLLIQGACVAAALMALEPGALAFGGLVPEWADRLALGLGWLWFVNLYNFMDGIDGITGVETACLGLGLAVAAPVMAPQGLILTAVALGFLAWNWHPARIFLGDSGSVPLGFLLGGLLVVLALKGQLGAALILPLYYVADATITLAWRLKDGERIWQPHRRHFYQRATRGKTPRSHAQVSLTVLACNLVLILAAAAAVQGLSPAAEMLAVAAVAALLALFTRWARP